MLALDTFAPPSPVDWIVDMSHVQADCAFYHAWPNTNYMPRHIGMAKTLGLATAAVLIPGQQPVPIERMLEVVCELGGGGDPIVFALLPGQLPPKFWLGQAIAAVRKLGYPPRRYGSPALLDSYPWAAGDWVSKAVNQVQRTTILPTPPVPRGTRGWEYCPEAYIHGNLYAVSVIDPLFFKE